LAGQVSADGDRFDITFFGDDRSAAAGVAADISADGDALDRGASNLRGKVAIAALDVARDFYGADGFRAKT
jgi:hypothetical protein